MLNKIVFFILILFPFISWGQFEHEKILALSLEGASKTISADLDLDGDLDFVVCANESGKIFALENEGNGNFKTPQVICKYQDELTNIFVEDLNGDLFPEVLFSANDVGWFENSGDGTFGPIQILSTDERAFDISSMDVNQDGKNDILISSYANEQFSWFRNLNGNSFASAQLIISDNEPRKILLEDLTGDGKKVVACFDRLSGSSDLEINESETIHVTGHYEEHITTASNESPCPAETITVFYADSWHADH